MSSTLKLVDSLENRVSKLLHRLAVMEQKNQQLRKELVDSKEENQRLHDEISQWEEKYKTLKIANSMLGSDTNKKEAKLKINTLIRQIDHCIAQLAE
jgi:predicted  nucleic acid-binding Zn-ribbon protein